MQSVLIDTNVIISFLINRNESQNTQATKLFTQASKRELEIVIHQNVLIEVVFVLQNIYELGSKKISEIMSELVLMPGIRRIDELNDTLLFKIWPGTVRDFGDAVLASVAETENLSKVSNLSVASFDKGFQAELKRLNLKVWKW